MLTKSQIKKVKSLLKDEKGSTAIIFGLMALPMFFAIGMAVDQGRIIRVETGLQNALDGGALAAMRSDDDAETVGSKYFAANFETPGTTPATVHFAKLEDGSVRATASVSVPALASAIMGMNTFQLETYSVVEPPHEVTTTETQDVATNTVPCLHVMDQSAINSFYLDSNSDLNASHCTVHVRSNRNTAMKDISSSSVKFRKIRVKGTASVSGGLQIVASPHHVIENADVVSNPYLDAIRDVVQALSIGNCTTANTGKTWTGAVSPGTYCGTTEFKNANFGTGLYIIKSGNGSNKDGALKLSGSLNGNAGVTFFFADSKSKLVSYNASENSVLKAPASGTTRGILFFEDSNRGATWNITIASCNKQSWTGLVYLPSANVKLDSLSEWPTLNISMAVNQLTMKSLSSVFTPYAWTPFNATNPITYSDDSESVTTTSTTTTEIYLRE